MCHGLLGGLVNAGVWSIAVERARRAVCHSAAGVYFGTHRRPLAEAVVSRVGTHPRSLAGALGFHLSQ